MRGVPGGAIGHRGVVRGVPGGAIGGSERRTWWRYRG